MVHRLLTSEFLESLSSDKETAIVEFGTELSCLNNSIIEKLSDQEKVELNAVIVAFLKAKAGITFRDPIDELPLMAVLNTLKTRMDQASESLKKRARKKLAEQTYNLHLNIFNGSHPIVYEFSDEEHNRIQELINELRAEIPKAPLIDEGHKQRLLRKLETLQQELHKKVSDLDAFFGFFGLLGIEIGKFGNNIKPLVDRSKEIGDIIINVVKAVEGVPSLPPATSMLQVDEGKKAL